MTTSETREGEATTQTQPAITSTSTDETADQANVVGMPSKIGGINKNEQIVKRLRFPDDQFAIVAYYDEKTGKPRNYRIVNIRAEKDGTQKAHPILDGIVVCNERAIYVALEPRTRELGDETQDRHYKLTFIDSLGTRNTTVVRDSEILENRRNLAWLSRLGLSEVVGARKHGILADLIRAVVYDRRTEQNMRVRVINRTGIVRVHGKLHYANGYGYVDPINGKVVNGEGSVFGVDGARTDIRCRPNASLDRQYSQIGYPETYPQAKRPNYTASDLAKIGSFEDAIELAEAQPEGVTVYTPKRNGKSHRLAALEALAELLDGYSDRGVTGVMVGQLISSPLVGLPLRDNLQIASVVNVVGPTQSGKTAYAVLIFSTQTQTVYGEVDPEFTARVAAPGASGGQTPAGITHHLKQHGGIVALLDDVMKDGWTDRHLNDAQTKIYGQVIKSILGSGQHQAQGNQGKTEPAESKKLYLSVVFTAERIGIPPTLVDDSEYNRMANLWWEAGKRCDQSTFDRLKSRDHTLRRNAGMRVVLDTLLENPDVLADGYERALRLLQDRVPDQIRILKIYATTLAGLHALDVAFEQNGKPGTTYLDDSIDGVVAQIERMIAYGSDGGDQRARRNAAEASRELSRLMVTQGGACVVAPQAPEDIESGELAVPSWPENLPEGFTASEHCGFVPQGNEWKPRSNAVRMGTFVAQLPGSGGRPHKSGFTYRIDMTTAEFANWHDRLNYEASLHTRDYRTCGREERVQALIEAGALYKGRTSTGVVYSLDFMWLWADQDDTEAEEDNG